MIQNISKNGLSMPYLGIGTWDLSKDVCSSIISEAIEIGYRHIDAAAMYENEVEVGNGIINSGIAREDVF